MYKHGVYKSEVPTSLVPPARTSAGLPVVFGTAPIHLSARETKPVNEPVLVYSYKEAVEALGYSKDWSKFTLCEFMKSHFALFNVAPVVFVNVLDPAVHKADVTGETLNFTAGQSVIEVEGILLNTIAIKSTDGVTTHVRNTDYTLAYDENGYIVATVKAGGGLTAENKNLQLSYTRLDPSLVTPDDIIGGVDPISFKNEGLELVNEVFPRFRLLPGQILAPGWSHNPAVAAVMDAKAGNINAHFTCISIADIPTDVVKNYTEVAAWKESNNYIGSQQIACWPMVKLGDDIFHMSTQLAGAICKTDAENEDVPYASPSNHNLKIDGAVLSNGTEVFLGPNQAAYLNGQGIVTALNLIGGWKVWGNRTGAYPAVTDPKDAFIPIRRMFNWIGNTLILTYWQKVDQPLRPRLAETIIDSCNIWLNGLSAREFILGGRVELLRDENPATDLMDGIVKFHVFATPPSPAREIDFVLEYDPAYLQTLFG